MDPYAREAQIAEPDDDYPELVIMETEGPPLIEAGWVVVIGLALFVAGFIIRDLVR